MLKARCYRLAPLLFGENHILVIFAQNICIRNGFIGLKMQNSPCSQITFGGFQRHGINFFSYMSKISIWYILIHDEFLENCYEKFVIKVFKIRLILHYRASRIPDLPGPLSGSWIPAARDFALRARDVRFAQIHYIFKVYASAPHFKKASYAPVSAMLLNVRC